jgi:Ca2+-binding RTX toxin-like protein
VANITGTNGDDVLTDTAGNDVIRGLGGADTITSTSGSDDLYGGAGNDLIYGGGSDVYVHGGAGDDTIYGSASIINFLAGNAGHNVIYGGGSRGVVWSDGGVDTIYGGGTYSWQANYFGSTSDLTVTQTAPNSFAMSNGTQAMDMSYVSYIRLGSGNDTVDLNAMHPWAGDSVLNGGAGVDTLNVDYSSQTDSVSFNGTRLALAGAHAWVLGGFEIANVIGGSGDDSLIGGAGDDQFIGGAGNDTLAGGAGVNLLDGGPGNDTVSYQNAISGVTVSLALRGTAQAVGAGATDTLTGFENLAGSRFGDVLTGDGAANLLSGRGGNDSLYGGAGDDRLMGGVGADRLTGGPGADAFVYTAPRESTVAGAGQDVITDFSHADGDKIDLSAISPDFTLVSAFSHSPDQLVEVARPGGFLILGDVNGDAKSDFAIFVQGATPLTSADFVL